MALDDRIRVHFDLAVFDADGEQVEGARGGRVFNRALLVELRVVAGTDEFLGGLVPGHGAAQVRAAVVDRQEAAIGRAHDVKAPVGDMCNRVGRKIVYGTSGNDRAKFSFDQPRLEIGCCNAGLNLYPYTRYVPRCNGNH